MNRIEIAVESLIGTDPEKARKNVSLACNTFSLDIQGFLELIRQNPKSIKIWSAICWYWVNSLSRRHGSGDYDLRNWQSCYIGGLLQQAVDEKYDPLPELGHDDFIKVFIGGMAYDHKTIQQSFSSLVFAWLDYLAREKGSRKAQYAVKRATEIQGGGRWYIMPMI